MYSFFLAHHLYQKNCYLFFSLVFLIKKAGRCFTKDNRNLIKCHD